jgi:hypothetical protein
MGQGVATRLKTAAAASGNWYAVARHLRDEAGKPDEDLIWPFIYAFEYDLTSPTEEERRGRWGAFAPMIEWEEGVHPPPLDRVPEEWLAAWEEEADGESQVTRARLHDLLWESRRGDRPDLHARAAGDAYVAVAEGGWDSLFRADSLIRSFELARALSDAERLGSVLTLMVAASVASLDSPRREPGVALRLIRSFLLLRRSDQPPEIDELLKKAMDRYADDPWLAQSITEMQAARLSDDEERRQLFEEQVERWRAAAAKADGLVGLHHLQTALELARDRGLDELADQLRREIQSVGPEQLDLKKVSASVEIPTDQVERLIDAFIAPDTWEEGLTRFGAYGPPSGDYEQNLGRVTELIEEHPLQSLFMKTLLGPENTIIRRLSSAEEHREAELIDYEARGIAMWGIWAAEVLDRLREKHGEPSPERLTDFFTTPLIVPEVAERVARAFSLYWANQPDEGAHILVPRLEAIIRRLCRELGLPVIREPRPPYPGGVRTLGDLVWSLRDRIDESWRRYLGNLLVEPLGVNLRNRVSHALGLPQARKQELALLLHAASFLRLGRVEAQEGNAEGS